MSEAEEEDAIGGNCECKEVGSEGKGHKNGSGSSAPGDDNSYLPRLSDDTWLFILARLPLSKYRDLRLVNRRFRSLIKIRQLIAIRKKIGIKEPIVFLFLSGGRCSFCYEPYTRCHWRLPKCPATEYLVNESFCVGTHIFRWGTDIWRYELESNAWFNGPTMITSRCNFASADCGSVACVAGGTHQVSREVLNSAGGTHQVSKKVLNSAEKYNPESKSWEPLLSSMNRQRKDCQGFYMDSKFYVIGGRNEKNNLLTCGEFYDFELNVWELIPNMLKNDKFNAYTAKKLTYFMVVVNNELYYFDFVCHDLMVYLKNKNTWKKVGSAPASLEKHSALALMSSGNELLLIGGMLHDIGYRFIPKTVLCVCTPSPDLDDVKWHVLDFTHLTGTVKNCCVMMV